MCLVDDSESFTVSNTVDRKARRSHECGECRRVISPGETYSYTTGLYDGHWDDFKMCAHCWRVASWLDVTCNGWLFNAVQEDLEEHWRESWELRSHYLGRAILGMRGKWRRKDGTLMALPRLFTRADLPASAR